MTSVAPVMWSIAPMAEAEALGGAFDGPAGDTAGDAPAPLPVQATTRTARAASEARSVKVGMVA